MFKITIILIVAYKGNSLLLNLVTFSKVPMPLIMTRFDNYVKSLIKSPNPLSNPSFSYKDESEMVNQSTTIVGKE